MHRFNTEGPPGLIDRTAPGAAPRLSGEQEAELDGLSHPLRAAALIEAGPDLETDGVVRWRCLDLKALIQRRFGVDYHARTIGKLLNRLGFSHISQRSRHYDQNPGTMAIAATGTASARKGTRSVKTVLTGTGKLALDIPRDRLSTFDPQLIAKYQRRFPGFDECPQGDAPASRSFRCTRVG